MGLFVYDFPHLWPRLVWWVGDGVLVGIFLGDEITGHGPRGRAGTAQMFQDFEATATDAEITALSETRTARAFMLLGRVAGSFD